MTDIGAYEEGLLKEVSPALLETIKKEASISESTDAKLKELCTGYTEGFSPPGRDCPAGEDEAPRCRGESRFTTPAAPSCFQYRKLV